MTIDSTIEQAKRNNRDAIAQLYEMFVERIYRYILYRVDSDADAEDLTAEVFVKMVEGLPQYTPIGVPFEAWLYRIASARVIDYRRRATRRPVNELTDNLSDDDTISPEDRVQNQEEAEDMRRAFSLLNDEQQQVLILRIIERKSHQEVADVIGKSTTAIKSVQYRALQILAGQLGETKVRHYLRGGHDDD